MKVFDLNRSKFHVVFHVGCEPTIVASVDFNGGTMSVADVDAQTARGDIRAPITSFHFGIRRDVSADHRLLAAESGWIDAFAEVFARMSANRYPAHHDRSQDETARDQHSDFQPIGNREPAHASSDPPRDLDSAASGLSATSSSQASPSQEVDDEDASDSTAARTNDVQSQGIAVPYAATDSQTMEDSAEAVQCDSEAALDQVIGLRENEQPSPGDDSNLPQSAPAEGEHAGKELASPNALRAPKTEMSENETAVSDSLASEQHKGETPPGESESSRMDLAAEVNSDRESRKHSGRRLPEAQETRSDVAAVSSASRDGAKSSSTSNAGQVGVTGTTAEITDRALPDSTQTSSQHAKDQPLATVNQIQGVAAAFGRSSNSASPSSISVTGWPLNAEVGRVSTNPSHREGSTPGDARSTSEMMARIKLIQRVSKAFHHLGKEGGFIRLRLAPAELGTVRVEMQVHHRQVNARVVAETENAGAVLREHLPELRARLESYGMQVERLDVETELSEHRFRSSQDGQSHWQSSEQQNRSGNGFKTASSRTPPASPGSDIATPFAPTATRGLPGDGVDIRL